MLEIDQETQNSWSATFLAESICTPRQPSYSIFVIISGFIIGFDEDTSLKLRSHL